MHVLHVCRLCTFFCTEFASREAARHVRSKCTHRDVLSASSLGGIEIAVSVWDVILGVLWVVGGGWGDMVLTLACSDIFGQVHKCIYSL